MKAVCWAAFIFYLYFLHKYLINIFDSVTSFEYICILLQINLLIIKDK